MLKVVRYMILRLYSVTGISLQQGLTPRGLAESSLAVGKMVTGHMCSSPFCSAMLKNIICKQIMRFGFAQQHDIITSVSTKDMI